MDLKIIFENEDYVIIDKPAGLVVHADGRTKEPTVTDWVLEKYPNIKEVGEPLTLSSGEVMYRPGIVHRIDRDTSGVLVITKTQKAFEYLKERFQSREVSKVYSAFVYGEMKTEEGTIDRPIGRSRNDFRLWSAQRGARGEMRDAVTEYVVTDRTHTGGPDAEPRTQEGATLVEVRPKTGRTHQIRVHFKAINHPIIADKLYAPKRPASLGFKRLALHARSVQFTAQDGHVITAEANLPQDFQEAIAQMKSL